MQGQAQQAHTTAEQAYKAEDRADTATHAPRTHTTAGAHTGTQTGHTTQRRTKEYTRVHRGMIR